ncbi:hypothetical protein JCM3770_001446 [Rhodotorula araucariae]
MSTAGPSTPLLERIERAHRRGDSRDAKGDLCRELLVELSSEANELRKGTRDLDTTLFGDAFALLDFLLPLLSADEVGNEPTMNLSDYSRNCITLVATVSSPKEVVMGAEQKLAELAAPLDSDDDDGENRDDPWDAKNIAFRLSVLTTMYTSALPRVQTKRPLQFLAPAINGVLGALIELTGEGAFAAPSPASATGAPPPEGDLLANEVFRAVLLFVRNVAPWVMKASAEDLDMARAGAALFDQLLMQTIALLHGFLPVGLAPEFFLKRFPSYLQRCATPEPSDSQLAWELADSLFYSLRLDPKCLFAKASANTAAPGDRLGAFVTLVHLVAVHFDITASRLGWSPDSLLSKTLGVLRTRQTSPVFKVADDEALFWMWWCVEQHLEADSSRPLASDVLFDLVDLLTPLASGSPDAQTRFLAFRLIARLVLGATGGATLEGEGTQLSLLQQLAVDCPVESLRAASIGLVKEVLLTKLALPPSTPSLFLSGVFSATPLGIALVQPDSSTLAHDTLSADEFVERRRAETMERLSLLFVLLRRDVTNRTGLAAPTTLAALRASFLSPLRTRIAAWLAVSEPYDPYIPGSNPNQPGGGPGPSGSGAAAGGSGAKNNKTAQIQQQIDDTVGIMRDNITKVAERGERLDALQDKTDNLAQSAQGFRRGANRVRKQMWWKDMKMRILIAVGIAILVIVIVVPIVVKK